MYSTAEANETPAYNSLEYQWDTFTEHIAQNAAKHAGGYRRDNGNNWAVPHIQCNLCADDRKDHQSKRIEHQKHFAQVRHYRSNDNGEYCGGSDDNPHIPGV